MSQLSINIEELARNTRIGRSIILALYVIQIHEWLSSLEDEYELVLTARWTFVKSMYIGCRYYPMVTWPVITWYFVGNNLPDICGQVFRLLYILLFPYLLLPQVIMVIRSWAFAGRRTFVAVFLGCLYTAFAATEIWVVVANVKESEPGSLQAYINNFGCFKSVGQDDLRAATRTGILFIVACTVDFFCIAVTWLHCFNIRSLQGSLGKMFLIEGFSAFLLLTAIHLATAVMAINQHTAAPFSGGFPLPISLALCNIVACRLVLDVRRRTSPSESQIDYRISNIVRHDLAFIDETMSETSTLVS